MQQPQQQQLLVVGVACNQSKQASQFVNHRPPLTAQSPKPNFIVLLVTKAWEIGVGNHCPAPDNHGGIARVVIE